MKVRLMCVVAVCLVMTPDVLRQKSRHVWTTDVSGEYQNVHNRMVAAMQGVGWGEAVRIQNVTDLEVGRCSTWAGYPDRISSNLHGPVFPGAGSVVVYLKQAPPLRAGCGPVAVAVTGPGLLGWVAR